MEPDTPEYGSPAVFLEPYESNHARGAVMTPLLAYWLWDSCGYLGDMCRECGDQPELIHDLLPPIARPYARAEWLDRFANCFDALATRIAAGEGDSEKLATCTGEEMALHLAIAQMESHLADGLIGPDVGPAEFLPDHGDDDYAFEALRDLLFTDHDVLMLYDASIDGIEDEAGKAWQVARYANLHPRDWFKPFAVT